MSKSSNSSIANITDSPKLLSRRAMLRDGTLILGAVGLSKRSMASLFAADAAVANTAVQMGLITDIHYADKEPGKTRFYRESLAKMNEAVDHFNSDKVTCVVQLGDLIDSGDTVEEEAKYLETIEAAFAQFNGPRHYVLGNHDAWSLSKAEFLAKCGATKEYYSFDQGGFHFVILDGCYRADGVPYGKKNFKWNDSEIPVAQRDWLKTDLAHAKRPTIVFVHQRLDVHNAYSVKSAAAVRQILEESGQVLAVFQGHSHKNDYHEINGIHYCTLRAIIEGSGVKNNGYSKLSIFPDRTIRLSGFRLQRTYDWKV